MSEENKELFKTFGKLVVSIITILTLDQILMENVFTPWITKEGDN